MAADGIHGIEVRGSEPKELLLSDGTLLRLEGDASDHGRVEWRRSADGMRGDGVSLGDALDLAGDEYSGYVAVRTRAEAEWMRAVADWYRERAELLTRELGAAAA